MKLAITQTCSPTSTLSSCCFHMHKESYKSFLGNTFNSYQLRAVTATQVFILFYLNYYCNFFFGSDIQCYSGLTDFKSSQYSFLSSLFFLHSLPVSVYHINHGKILQITTYSEPYSLRVIQVLSPTSRQYKISILHYLLLMLSRTHFSCFIS